MLIKSLQVLAVSIVLRGKKLMQCKKKMVKIEMKVLGNNAIVFL